MLAARRRPCGDCPWRTDAPIGHFPPEAFERLLQTNIASVFHVGQACAFMGRRATG